MTICRTQAEVDAAVSAGKRVELDSSWRDNASAVLRDNASAVLWDNASAVLRGNASADLWDNASADLRGNASADLWDNASAVLWDNASAVLRDNASADLWDNASADLWDNASADLRGNARAVLWGNASAVLGDNASAVLGDNASAVLGGWLTSARIIGPNAKAAGVGRWLRVDTAAAWAKYQGLTVSKGTVTLYKAVAADGTGGRGHNVTYEGGATVEALDWDSSHRECGGGLHLCATADQARAYGVDVARVLACRVHLDDIAVYEPNLDKVRCRRVEVLREVAK